MVTRMKWGAAERAWPGAGHVDALMGADVGRPLMA